MTWPLIWYSPTIVYQRLHNAVHGLGSKQLGPFLGGVQHDDREFAEVVPFLRCDSTGVRPPPFFRVPPAAAHALGDLLGHIVPQLFASEAIESSVSTRSIEGAVCRWLGRCGPDPFSGSSRTSSGSGSGAESSEPEKVRLEP